MIGVFAVAPLLAIAAVPASVPAFGNSCDRPKDWAPPFTRVYHLTNGATLVFVATEHTSDVDDATHQQIKVAFERYAPDFALTEGMSATKSAFDWYRRGEANLASKAAGEGRIQETLYTVKLAADRGTGFSGWDFSPDQDYKALVAAGFDLSDAIGAHLLRSRIDPFDGGSHRQDIDRQIRYASTVRPITGFDYPAWYRRTYGDDFRQVYGTPCGMGIATRIVRAMDDYRNANLVRLIADHATPRRTLLVEAGANHWLALQGYLAAISRGVTTGGDPAKSPEISAGLHPHAPTTAPPPPR